jgi:hypothetical protein
MALWPSILGVLLFAGLSCALAGCGAASSRGMVRVDSRRAAHPRTGLGSKLAEWETAYPKGSGGFQSGCTGEGCYGKLLVNGGHPTYQFTAFSTTGAPDYRVDGYEQALGEGTPLAAAKAAVLELLPRDTRTTAFWVVRDGSEYSCALWNLSSPTLGRWLSGSGPGAEDPQGAIGVNLFTTTARYESVFTPGDVSSAIVAIAAAPKDASC